MTRPSNPLLAVQRLAAAAFLATLAGAIAVPQPVRAECALRSQRKCCCEHRTNPVDTCVTRVCGCCQSVPPQNLPAERVSLQTDLVATSAIESSPHGGSEFASTLGTAQAIDVAAIPHRILHCSWLI